MTDTCSPGSHPHADQPNWKPAETADEYLANLRDGLEVYSERRLCKLLGTTRIDLWRSKMMAAIPDALFDQLVNRRRTSARELAVIGSMFAGQAMHGVEVDRCPHCSGVLRTRRSAVVGTGYQADKAKGSTAGCGEGRCRASVTLPVALFEAVRASAKGHYTSISEEIAKALAKQYPVEKSRASE